VICKYNQNNEFKWKEGENVKDKKFFSQLFTFRGVEKDKKDKNTFVNIFPSLWRW